jgi:hypothetical protein
MEELIWSSIKFGLIGSVGATTFIFAYQVLQRWL